MSNTPVPVPKSPQGRLLTAAAFQGLADVPPEMEWFANLGNPATRRAYQTALQDFMRFTGINAPRGVPDRHAGPCHRLARRARPPCAVGHDHPPPPVGARIPIRVLMREECRDP